MPLMLSKSDFKLAHDCPVKLYYKKRGYPTSKDSDEYLQYLAKGGYMVGKLATLYYPTGILVETGSDHDQAIKLTEDYLNQENVVLFEAAIQSGQKIIRIDILEKKGNYVNLIEVKSKSYETTTDAKKAKKVLDGLEDYILDIAYQYQVLKEAHPSFNITPYLFLPDRSKNTSIEGLNSLFRIESIINAAGHFRQFNVSFDDSRMNEVLKDDILTLVNIYPQVIELQGLVASETELFLGSLQEPISKIEHPVSKNCFKCEYDISNEHHPLSGSEECWSDYPKVENHIAEIYHIGSVGGFKKPYANELIKDKMISFTDVSFDRLGDKALGQRQKIQILNTLDNTEWIDPSLSEVLDRLEYPLHFIDFETSMSALPYHKGMRPYETLAFQWSCHTIEQPGSEPIHSEWINFDPSFPSFKFAEALMQQIGDAGTPLMWATHEKTILKTIKAQVVKYNYNSPDLVSWLNRMVDDNGNTKLVDMNDLTLHYYFHPSMKGKTSIKWTLPSVLKATTSDRIKFFLSDFEPGISLLKYDKDGNIDNPYSLLPSIDIYEDAERVDDGTGAMTAYDDLMFGLSRGKKEVAEAYKQALLKYCKLDTLSMVIIWQHWNDMLKLKS